MQYAALPWECITNHTIWRSYCTVIWSLQTRTQFSWETRKIGKIFYKNLLVKKYYEHKQNCLHPNVLFHYIDGQVLQSVRILDFIIEKTINSFKIDQLMVTCWLCNWKYEPFFQLYLSMQYEVKRKQNYYITQSLTAPIFYHSYCSRIDVKWFSTNLSCDCWTLPTIG